MRRLRTHDPRIHHPCVWYMPSGGRNLCTPDSHYRRVLFKKFTYQKRPWDNKPSLVVWDAVIGEHQKARLPKAFLGNN